MYTNIYYALYLLSQCRLEAYWKTRVRHVFGGVHGFSCPLDWRRHLKPWSTPRSVSLPLTNPSSLPPLTSVVITREWLLRTSRTWSGQVLHQSKFVVSSWHFRPHSQKENTSSAQRSTRAPLCAQSKLVSNSSDAYLYAAGTMLFNSLGVGGAGGAGEVGKGGGAQTEDCGGQKTRRLTLVPEVRGGKVGGRGGSNLR